MNQAELLENIDSMIETEESAVAIYTRHTNVAATMLRMDDPEDTEQIKHLLTTMAKDSQRHKNILLSVIENIVGGSKDA